MAAENTRIEGLLQAMSFDEKLGQITMVRADFGEAGAVLGPAKLAEIQAGRAGSILDLWGVDRIHDAQRAAVEGSRLGIPLLFTLDVLHGYETIFPIPLGEAAAFDPSLWQRTAHAAAIEAASAGIALTYAPMLDVGRDPRWGRIAESPGEDPWLASRFAKAKVRGFQQGDLSHSQAVAATAKHFAGYAAVMAGREYASVDISARTLEEVHFPPFLASVRAGVAAIMPAFVDLAGVPMTAHRDMLDGVLRRRWGFDGVIVSDFGAVGELLVHGVAADAAEAAALALNAGVDIDMVSGAYLEGLPVALARGLVSMEQIDNAVRRVLKLKAALGLFENPFGRGSRALTPAQREEHRALARDAARRSIVLLQNRNGLLPLKAGPGRLAVAGPLSDAAGDMLGPWRAAGDAKDTVSFLDGLKKALPGWCITRTEGCAPRDALREADVILLCAGESASMCGEATSRARPTLPDDQRRLAEAVLASGKPVIVALTSGRPLIDPWLFEKADAVLATWFLGSEAGAALADILTGATNPSGKLPVSWPCDAGQIPIFYAQRPSGRPAKPNEHDTSKYLDVPVEPQFVFGHGLSFTRFVYGEPRASSEIVRQGDRFFVEADITNEGAVEGEETAFLFIRDPVATVARPLLELKGFEKIRLAPGASGTVRFELTSDDLGFPGKDGELCLEPGEVQLLVGPSSGPTMLKSCRVQVSTEQLPRLG
jgi:beta-glucosidase